MNRAPIVSVVIPAHNEERFLGRCIRSVLNQTFPVDDMEVIVVNDGSDDRTQFALGLFQDEIRILLHEECRGLPAALNTGIRSARGRFVVRVDADDYVHAEYVNVLSMHLLMNPHVDAVACDYQVVDDEERIIRHVDCIEEPIGCGIMFRIEHLIELGLYDEEMLVHEERDLRMRFEQARTIHPVRLPLYRYRRHEGNLTADPARVNDYLERLHEKHGMQEQ